MISTMRRPDQDWIDRHADAWVAADLISPDQATAICTFEHDELPSTGAGRPSRRLTVIAETAAYLGSVLALMGGAVAVGTNWDNLTFVGRTVVGLVVAVVGFVAGTWLARIDEPGTRRLGAFLWTVGTGGAVLAIGVLADELGVEQPGGIALAIGLSAVAIGVTLWRGLDRPLQLLTVVAGSGIALGGAGELLGVPAWITGLVGWALAVAFGAAAVLDRVRPRLVAVSAAIVAAEIGALTVMDLDARVGSLLAAATAAVAVLVALWDRHVALLAVAIVAFVFSIQTVLQTTLAGPVASLVVAMVGVVVVVVTVVRATRRTPVG